MRTNDLKYGIAIKMQGHTSLSTQRDIRMGEAKQLPGWCHSNGNLLSN
jgi:hypothetical protein